MEIVVFVPGILGSKLATPDGEEVWPPTPREALFGYRRTEKLLRDDLIPTGIVESVCIDVYGSVLEAIERLGYSESDAQFRLVRHAYDWRRDLVALGEELGERLAALVAEHGTSVQIKLICHSMGGLVTRALLEGSGLARQPWAKAVKLAIFMATPHEGAPLAFARAVGVGGSSTGLNEKQLRRLAEAPGYPAGYQLFPPAHLVPLWRLDDPVPFMGASLFDPAVAANYRLVDAHLQATKDFHSRLDPDRRPAGCRYFSIVSAAHETVTRLDQDKGRAIAVAVKSAGDGTVPIQSAAALNVQTAFVEANHVGITQKSLTHRMIGMLLGILPVEPLTMAFDLDGTSAGAAVNLSLSERSIGAGQIYEIVVTTPPQDVIDAYVRITRQGPDDPRRVSEIKLSIQSNAVERISLRGPDLPVGYYLFELVTAIDNTVADKEELLVTGEHDD